MKLDVESIGIQVKVIEGQKIKAIISLDFGEFVVKGFRVMDSQFENPKGDKLWLTPPSYVGGGRKYHPIFFMPNKELWSKLESRIWDAYYQQTDRYFKKRMDVKEDDFIVIEKSDLPP